MNENNHYRVQLRPLETVTNIKAEWIALEERSQNDNFFLSWTWISTWLETYEPHADVIQVFHKGITVALGVLVPARQRRHGWLLSSTLRLHQTGKEHEDQIWIEYNSLLANPEHKHPALKAMMRHLSTDNRVWDEFITGATDTDTAKSLTIPTLERYEIARLPTYNVDLKAIRESGKTYLEALSRNCRYQINRAKRLYEKSAPLSLEVATNLEQALNFFGEIAPLHTSRWRSTPEGSGFDNSHFMRFHQTLINKGWEKQEIQLCKLSVGGRSVCYLYNFIYRGRIYFYLSGVESVSNPKLKPGLLCHALCIQQHIDNGLRCYDFMGGDMEYKRRLGKPAEVLVINSFQRKRLKLQAEHLFRRFKNHWIAG